MDEKVRQIRESAESAPNRRSQGRWQSLPLRIYFIAYPVYTPPPLPPSIQMHVRVLKLSSVLALENKKSLVE
jgi:hypothetical protein